MRKNVYKDNSMKDGAPRDHTKFNHTNRLAGIISYLSVVISVLPLIVSITGYRASRQEWTRSGAELEYALPSPSISMEQQKRPPKTARRSHVQTPMSRSSMYCSRTQAD